MRMASEDQIDDWILQELERWPGTLSYHELQWTVFRTWPHRNARSREHTRIIRRRLKWLSLHGFIYAVGGCWYIVE